jgi:hypothetical protein
LLTLFTASLVAQSTSVEYQQWTRQQAEAAGRSMRVDGRVGGAWDLRVVRTERSYNYKLRATLMTPVVIRATARLAQLSNGLTNEETAALIKEGDDAGDVVALVEIDPREGSGVVPLDMVVLLRPKGAGENATIRGMLMPALRNARALAGVFRRDYAYEQFWAVFSLGDDRSAAFRDASATEAELVVRIYDKEGRVSWSIPDALRGRKVRP